MNELATSRDSSVASTDSNPTANYSRGFTLIELIVSVGLFAIVMLVATSAYFSLIAVDRQARATDEVVNNISFAVDAMTRGMRTGTGYQCIQPSGPNNITNCTCFSYTDSYLNTAVTYHLMSNHTIGREIGSATCLDSKATAITDPNVSISALPFYVRGVGGSDNIEPEVLFTVKGTVPSTSAGGTASFTLEENATQRLLDI